MAKEPRPSPGEVVRFAKDLELLCKRHNVSAWWFEVGKTRYELSEIGKLDKVDYRTGSFRFKFGGVNPSLGYDWSIRCVNINSLPSDLETLLIAKMLECTFGNTPSPWTIPQL